MLKTAGSLINPSRMSDIATRIHRRMRKLGLNETRLSEACSIEAMRLAEAEEPPRLSRDRISKILMHRNAKPARAAARGVSQPELNILARVLEVSVEWLAGRGRDDDPVVWDLLGEPHRGAHVLHLLEEYEEVTTETLVWSEYLMCSFTSEEFMYAFHRAHFGQTTAMGFAKDTKLVEFFNKAGKARRDHILRAGRSFTFTNLIHQSDLERIARGEGEYGTIPKRIRKGGLETLVRIINDPALKMNLVVVKEAHLAAVKAALRDHETVGVMIDLFSIWNYHSGSVGWSEHPKYVTHHGRLLNQMRQSPLGRDVRETTEYLAALISKM